MLRRTRGLGAVVVLLVALAGAACSQTSSASSNAAPQSPPMPLPASAYARVPVLLVHGHGNSSFVYSSTLAYLAASYPPGYLLAIDIVPDNLANVRAAEEFIAPAVDRLLASATAAAHAAGYAGPPPTKVNIVAHSMGALSSRWYTTQLRPDLVRTWISVTGANHGSNFACMFNDETASELCPAFSSDPVRQPLQTTLNGTPTTPIDQSPYGRGADPAGVAGIPPDPRRAITYFTVRLAQDEYILPAESGAIDGSGGAPVALPNEISVIETSTGNYLFDEPTDHAAILDNADFHRLLGALLASAEQVSG